MRQLHKTLHIAIKKLIIPIALFISYHQVAVAQDTVQNKRIKVLPVPTFGYTPETSTYIGAVALFTIDFYQDGLTRTSNTKIEFSYTWNRQLILETQWNYFFREEKWFTRGDIHFSKYPDLYYGIGAKTPDENELKFESNRVITDMDMLRRIKKDVFAGVGLRYLNYSNLSFYDSINPFPELRNSSNFGIKLIYLKDSRNNILNPSKGRYLELLNTHNFGSDYYSLVGFDFRRYYEMKYNNEHVLAARFYTTFILGTPAFYDYSLIGGDKYVRGYFYGRYRDQNFSTLQLEYRCHLFWRIGLAGFGGISMIYNSIGDIDENTFKPNGGIGLRILVDKSENTNLRIDYAVGANGQNGIYFTFGESF